MKRLFLIALIACIPLAAQESNGESSEPSSVWRWANFVILAAGLGYLTAKFLPPVLRTRTGEIQKGISEAQQMKSDAEKRASEMEAKLKALGADVESFRVNAAAEMQREAQRIQQDTAAQIQRLQEQAGVEIESASKTARRELKQYAADLALELAEKRIRERIDGTSDAALVDGFVSDLSRQGSKN
jgi:F-type H+-transporting ATPase subunit b